MVGDRDVAWRARLGGRAALSAARRGPVHPLRVVRLRLLERLGHGERAAPADHPRLRDERQRAARGTRRTPAPLFAYEAGIQDDEIPGLDDVYGQTTGRLLGGSGLSLVRRDLAKAPTSGRQAAFQHR